MKTIRILSAISLSALLFVGANAQYYTNNIGSVYGNIPNSNQYYQNYNYGYSNSNNGYNGNTLQNYNNQYYYYNPVNTSPSVSVSAVTFSILTNSATNIGQNTAQLNGSISAYNFGTGQTATTYFEYGTSPSGLNIRTTPSSVYGPGSSYANPLGLGCSTTYYFRAVITSNTTNYGDILNFTTSPCSYVYNNQTPIYNNQSYYQTPSYIPPSPPIQNYQRCVTYFKQHTYKKPVIKKVSKKYVYKKVVKKKCSC